MLKTWTMGGLALRKAIASATIQPMKVISRPKLPVLDVRHAAPGGMRDA